MEQSYINYAMSVIRGRAIPDIREPELWQAYTGSSGIGALQAFYWRELPAHGWEITEFISLPNQADLDFVRLQIRKGGTSATLGIMPSEGKNPLGKIAIKYQ